MLKISNPEAFHHVTQGFQAIVLSAAAAIGGVWAIYTFHAQLQVESAKAQLEKLRRDMLEQANLEIAIDASVLKPPSASERYIIGQLKVRNSGNTNSRLQIPREAIHLARATIEENGTTSLKELSKTQFHLASGFPLDSLSIYPGMGATASFALKVSEPGLYLISFSTPRNEREQGVARRSGNDKTEYVWASEKYIFVD